VSLFEKKAFKKRPFIKNFNFVVVFFVFFSPRFGETNTNPLLFVPLVTRQNTPKKQTKTKQTKSAIEEMQMLKHVARMRDPNSGRLPRDLQPVNPADAVDGKDPDATPMKVWKIMPNDLKQRQDLRKQVFQPGWRLPTMTPEEWAEEEMRRGGLPDPDVLAQEELAARREHERARQRPGYESADSGDERDSDDGESEVGLATRDHAEGRDVFRDDNPKGWGNKVSKLLLLVVPKSTRYRLTLTLHFVLLQNDNYFKRG
jgi:TAP42-like family